MAKCAAACRVRTLEGLRVCVAPSARAAAQLLLRGEASPLAEAAEDADAKLARADDAAAIGNLRVKKVAAAVLGGAPTQLMGA